MLTLAAAYLAFGGILFDRVETRQASDRDPVRPASVIEHNLAAERDATPLFYTEVEGWRDYQTPQPKTP